MDLDKKEFYLKDRWRMSPGRATLNKVVEGTRRVSKFICAGSEDSEQGMRKDTVIQGGSCVSWLCEEPARANYVHHQVASDDDMKPLDQLKSSRHLVSIMLDALKAHRDAYEKHGVLHRDISVANILIGGAGQGLLIDCDPARPLGTPVDGKDQQGRTCSWKFMSLNLINHPSKPHLLQDDLESFFHVLLYNAFRYFPIDKSKYPRLAYFMKEYFDDVHTTRDGKITMGTRRYLTIISEEHVESEGCGSLTTVLAVARAYVRQWHLHESDALQRLASNEVPLDDDKTRQLDLYNHDMFIEIHDVFLNHGEWPDHDKVDSLDEWSRKCGLFWR